MKNQSIFTCFLAVWLLPSNFARAAESPSVSPLGIVVQSELERLPGQPVDIAPWAYAWRSDRAVQEQPEAYFIPRRLERIDKVYRTAYDALSPKNELKSLYYKLPDLLQPLPPAPKGRLQAGLLWVGRVSDFQVELKWPEGIEIPTPDAVEVRIYPTAFGWFGWTVDKTLTNPQISEDKRTWTYKNDPTAKMDTAYDVRVDAATEMVAIFFGDAKTPDSAQPVVPTIRMVGPNIGTWKRMDVEIEWGFQPGTEKSDFDGQLESSIAMTGPIAPLPDDKGTTVAEGGKWQSRASADSPRRGIVVPLLYAPDSRPGLDSRITVWTKPAGFTFRISDLEKGPILIPQHGVFITKTGPQGPARQARPTGQTAQQFAKELAAKSPKSIRQMVAEHREPASFAELLQEVRLWNCPEGTKLAPFPQVPDPPMQVELPDPSWTAAWRAAANQLRGPHMWGGLAFEVGRVAHEMDMIGLHQEADMTYQHFLKSPGVKSDGDYSDGNDALEWASTMRHDMGYSHDGTHASTGRLLFAMAERYFLTGDKTWFQTNRARLQAAADWIIRQRTEYMKDVPNRKDLFVAGLLPPCMLGDYALPACDWHWYYCDNALALQGLQRFADALVDFDAEAGKKYQEEAAAFRADFRRVLDREAALAPVRLGRDGAYHSYIPRMAYARGVSGLDLGAPQFPDCDFFIGSLPVSEPFAVLPGSDPRMVDTIEMMEEMGTSPGAIEKRVEARKKKGLPTDDAWFSNCFVILPKASYNANIYLLQDDVPNFLRFWMNSYAATVAADGRLWEPWHPTDFEPCTAPDNGTAGWFMENFRDLLVQEEGQSLWLAKATPRNWLEQGKKIAVKNAPTYFGSLAYEITSDVDHGKIAATVKVPTRAPVREIVVRFRHPQKAPIKTAKVNGQAWTDFDPVKEIIRLHDVTGSVKVEAGY